MAGLLGDNAALCLSTTPILPPRRDDRFPALVRSVRRVIEPTAIAGLTGRSQINLRQADHRGTPVCLTIGPKGSEETLVA